MQGRGAQAVAPQVRPAVSPPRAASGRSLQPRPLCARRPLFPSAPSPAGGRAAGAREPANGGGGRRGGGAPIPVTFAGLKLHTHHSPFWPVRKSSSPAPSPPKKTIPERLALTVKPWGVSCLIPFSCFGGSRRFPSAPRTPRRASKRVSSRVEPAPNSGRGTGPQGTPPAAPAGRRTHSVLDARANNTASRRRRPPPAPSPRAPLHNWARGSAPETGGTAGLSPPNLPSFPPEAIPRLLGFSHLRF